MRDAAVWPVIWILPSIFVVYAVIIIIVSAGGEVKEAIEIRRQIFVSNPRLAKRRHARVPASHTHVQACERGDCASKRVTHQHNLVFGIRGERVGYGGEDNVSGVVPRGVESGVDGAVCAARLFIIIVVV